MKKSSILGTPVKGRFVLLTLLSLSLALYSCGNNREEAGEDNNRIMDEGMMQDSATREDGMGPGMMVENGMMDDGGMMSEEMRKAMMSKGMGPEMMQDMQVIHSLLMQHEKIKRSVSC